MNIGEMQRKLSHWAEHSKEHRFFDLFHLIYDKDWLRLAHDYVKQNAGSITAGCDGINLSAFDEDLAINLQRLSEELKSESFEPQPVRRVYIPKSNGKVRPLGIPSIRDRIVQQALRMILEPIYEADFSPYSFGFRPDRCTMDAIKCVIWSTQESKKCFWIVEGDISSYFDTINHRRLIKIIRRRVKDEKIIRLIWKFLRAGVMEGKLFRETKLGTPQGGIVSPLLANIYLNELDKYMKKYTGLSAKEKAGRRKQGQANFVYVRYADDFVVLCNGTRKQAEEIKEELYRFLKGNLRVNLSKEKTRITHLNDGFNFLGFKIKRSQGNKGMTTKVLIAREAVEKLRDKIKIATASTSHRDSVNSKILALNRIISGWCRYYQYTSKANTTFNRVVHEGFWCMAHWLGRKYQLSIPEVMKRYRRGNTIATREYRLKEAAEFPTLAYKKRFLKENPYTTQRTILREELPQERYWTGYESRPGMADLRMMILKRDRYACQMCDKAVTSHTSEIDHIKPVRRFKKPVDANTPGNLWTLCIPCHREKSEQDRQMESRMH
jgi:group II intron reverse transcriptase/maturase